MSSRFHALQVDSTGSDDEDYDDSPSPLSASTATVSPVASSIPPSAPPTSATTAATSAAGKKSKGKKKKPAPVPTSSSIVATHTSPSKEAASLAKTHAEQISNPVKTADGETTDPVNGAAAGAGAGANGVGVGVGAVAGVEEETTSGSALHSRGHSVASLSTISSRPSPSPSVTSESDSELSEPEPEPEVSSDLTPAPPTSDKSSLASRLPGLARATGHGRRGSSSTVMGGGPSTPTAASFLRGPNSTTSTSNSNGAAVADGEGPTGTIRGKVGKKLASGINVAGLGGIGGKVEEEGSPKSEDEPPTPPEGKEKEKGLGAAIKQQLQPQQQDHGKDHNPSTKWKNAAIRTIWGLVMAGGFISLLVMGPVYMVILVMALQAMVFSELSSLFEHGYRVSHGGDRKEEQNVSLRRQLAREKKKAEREKWSKVMSWYFFAVTNYFLYGETIIYYFKHIVLVDAYFIPFARHHRFISFMLYIIGFVGFVANLDRNHLRRQFGLFAWIHMTLVLILFSSHFIVDNILEGLIWLWIPASLVIMNDIMAYVFGMAFGRTQLIQLSPKKTVEGFVGAFFATVIFGVVWGTIFMRYNYMICPVRDLGASAFSAVQCKPNNVFAWREYQIPDSVTAPLHLPSTSFPWAPFQLHCIAMAVFASLVAPFGGFFASGFKRAFNIKDFGDSIPGHGGLTDRFDCQFLMGLFSYVYYTSLVREHHVSVGAVLQTITTALEVNEQVELLKDLQRYLAGQGISY